MLEHLRPHVDLGCVRDGDLARISVPIDVLGVNYYRRGAVTGLAQPLSKHIPLYDFIPKLSYSRNACPVCDALCAITCTGVPSHTT